MDKNFFYPLMRGIPSICTIVAKLYDSKDVWELFSVNLNKLFKVYRRESNIQRLEESMTIRYSFKWGKSVSVEEMANQLI